ncbi:MAG: hypothetical protein HGB33_10635, partial [Syntrophaceae bacterium]|nr:hypothetical protein [Syntrophaceae bacterium]
MSWIKKCFALIIIALSVCPFNVLAQDGDRQNPSGIRNNDANGKKIVNKNKPMPYSVMAITPRELDIGTIGAGETLSGVFTLKNMGAGSMSWYTFGPEGWKAEENQRLSGVVENGAASLRVEVQVSSNGPTANASKSKASVDQVKITMSAGNARLVCRKNLSAGQHREAIKVISVGGSRTIFVKFKIVDNQELAQINLNPERLDMGSVRQGKNISKKIRLTNKGKEILNWSVAAQKQRYGDIRKSLFKKEKYISFGNEEMRGRGVYTPPADLKESMYVSGKWAEND